jgi:hypothetical protein
MIITLCNRAAAETGRFFRECGKAWQTYQELVARYGLRL